MAKQHTVVYEMKRLHYQPIEPLTAPVNSPMGHNEARHSQQEVEEPVVFFKPPPKPLSAALQEAYFRRREAESERRQLFRKK